MGTLKFTISGTKMLPFWDPIYSWHFVGLSPLTGGQGELC